MTFDVLRKKTSENKQSKFELSSEQGFRGPSGLDSNKWRRLLTSFMSSSIDLIKTIAKRIATVHFTFLLPCNLCRLIALDKCPGTQPIGIREILRRIIEKTIVKCNKPDHKILGGDLETMYR